MAGTSPAKTRAWKRLFLQKAGEFLLEPRQPAAAVDQVLLAAGPGRMRFRIDVEPHGVARLAPGAPRLEFGAVGHHHLDGVILGMNVALHGLLAFVGCAGYGARRLRGGWGLAGSIAHRKLPDK